jgi:hypothetical protein
MCGPVAVPVHVGDARTPRGGLQRLASADIIHPLRDEGRATCGSENVVEQGPLTCMGDGDAARPPAFAPAGLKGHGVPSIGRVRPGFQTLFEPQAKAICSLIACCIQAGSAAIFSALLTWALLPFQLVRTAIPSASLPLGMTSTYVKRPGYLVALPYVGTIAFDVKSKTHYGDGFLFDAAEVRGLALFDDIFRISTFFACLDPQGSDQSLWFRLPELTHFPVRTVKGKSAFAVPLSAGIPVSMARPFQEALRDTISLG